MYCPYWFDPHCMRETDIQFSFKINDIVSEKDRVTILKIINYADGIILNVAL